jgi:Sortase and related acyltransferases
MKLIPTTVKDIPQVIQIINDAKQYLKASRIPQWQNGYPNEETIAGDIIDGTGFVLIDNDIVVGTVCVSFAGEATYDKIYEGYWLTVTDPFAVVHRIAISDALKGHNYATKMLDYIVELCLEKDIHSIKIDTHKENRAMQRLLKKNGFTYCGIILLDADSAEQDLERIAFERVI